MYKTFMKHAEKVAKGPATKERKALQGIMHYENGDAAVTDSHRLYYIKDIHDKGDSLLSPKGKKVEGKYPDVIRLFPNSKLMYAEKLKVDELIKAVELAVTSAKVESAAPIVELEDHAFMFKSVNLTFLWELSNQEPIPFGMRSNAQYWLDALKLFKALKYTEVELNLYGIERQFVLISPDEKLTALILPVRRF